jgi:2-iminobutanoate/2-iminopropanoate deaminase
MTRPERQSIRVSGLTHGDSPFPVAARKGRHLYASAIHGLDLQTGLVPESVEDEIAGVFANIRRVIEAAGGTPLDIMQVTAFARSRDIRKILNMHWLELFPDLDSRPVRHLMLCDLPASLRVHAESVAVLSPESTQ